MNNSKGHVVRVLVMLVMGDFNLPGIDWVQEQGKGRVDEDFLVLVQDCFF